MRHTITMLGFGLYTQALTYERVHTLDTKWKELGFYANTPDSLNRISNLHIFLFFNPLILPSSKTNDNC